MPLYMYQVSYTPQAVAAMVREPQDRIEAVRPAIEALGGKLVAAGYPFGEYDAVVLYEAPDDASAAAFALAVASGGAAKSAKTTRLLSGQEWIESLRKVQGSEYRPPQLPSRCVVGGSCHGQSCDTAGPGKPREVRILWRHRSRGPRREVAHGGRRLGRRCRTRLPRG